MNAKQILRHILLIFKGMLVGFGAILPGVSGGTLCVAFGMYQPLLNVLSHPRKAIREDGVKLLVFLIGGAIGFVGLAGLANRMLTYSAMGVVCVFIGLLLGTLPEQWKTAGEKGRGASSYAAMGIGFAALLALLLLLRRSGGVQLAANVWGYLLCGVMWGLSFVVPGLSSSTLLIFFGLYQPMLEGISHLSIPVLLPLGIGAGACLLLLPRAVTAAYRRWYAQASHAVLGIVVASAVMILPAELLRTPQTLLTGLGLMALGTLAALGMSKLFSSTT